MKRTEEQQVPHHRGNYLVRRQRLLPGQATPWHRDPYHQVTVVLSGDLLNVEFPMAETPAVRDHGGAKWIGRSQVTASIAL